MKGEFLSLLRQGASLLGEEWGGFEHTVMQSVGKKQKAAGKILPNLGLSSENGRANRRAGEHKLSSREVFATLRRNQKARDERDVHERSLHVGLHWFYIEGGNNPAGTYSVLGVGQEVKRNWMRNIEA